MLQPTCTDGPKRWSAYNIHISDDDGFVLLFNCRTGGLIRLAPDRARMLNDEPCALPADLLTFFHDQGFVLDATVDEFDLLASAHETARTAKNLFSATIELTEACNFRCVYCYQAHETNHLADQSVEDKVVRFLKRKMEEVEQIHVNWFGGEPLLRMTVLDRMSRRLAKEASLLGRNFSQFITTNGYLLNQNVAQHLVELGVEHVQITVDGGRSSHDPLRRLASGEGTYDRVLDGCTNTVLAGMSLMVRVNLNRAISHNIESLLDDLEERGITSQNATIHVVRAVDHGTCDSSVAALMYTNQQFAKEWAESLRALARRGFSPPSLSPRAYNCSFDLQKTVMIGWDGSLRHCTSSDGKLGELSEDGEEVNHTALHDSIKSRRLVDYDECVTCIHLPLCMGGCAYLRELGEECCNPEHYVLDDLVRLTTEKVRELKSEMPQSVETKC